MHVSHIFFVFPRVSHSLKPYSCKRIFVLRQSVITATALKTCPRTIYCGLCTERKSVKMLTSDLLNSMPYDDVL